MSKYLDHIRGLVDTYKPLVERKLGYGIEFITVKSMSEFDGFRTVREIAKESPLGVRLLSYAILVPMHYVEHLKRRIIGFMSTGPNVIRVNDNYFHRLLVTEEFTHMAVVHELAHRVQRKINPNLYRIPLSRREDFRRGCIIEGFAEFMTLEYLIDLYLINMGQHLQIEREDNLRMANRGVCSFKQSLGYRFFNIVANETRRDGNIDLEFILNIIKNPEIPIEHIRNPEFFLKSQ